VEIRSKTDMMEGFFCSICSIATSLSNVGLRGSTSAYCSYVGTVALGIRAKNASAIILMRSVFADPKKNK